MFERIGIGQKDDFGQPYEEWFITDYDCYVDGLYDKLGEYENLDELNYLDVYKRQLQGHLGGSEGVVFFRLLRQNSKSSGAVAHDKILPIEMCIRDSPSTADRADRIQPRIVRFLCPPA